MTTSLPRDSTEGMDDMGNHAQQLAAILPLTKAAAVHNITRQRMHALIKQNRVPGATLTSDGWMLPSNFTILPPPKRKRLLHKITTKAAP